MASIVALSVAFELSLFLFFDLLFVVICCLLLLLFVALVVRLEVKMVDTLHSVIRWIRNHSLSIVLLLTIPVYLHWKMKRVHRIAQFEQAVGVLNPLTTNNQPQQIEAIERIKQSIMEDGSLMTPLLYPGNALVDLKHFIISEDQTEEVQWRAMEVVVLISEEVGHLTRIRETDLFQALLSILQKTSTSNNDTHTKLIETTLEGIRNCTVLFGIDSLKGLP